MPNLRQVFSRSFVLRPTLRPIDFLISDCDVESVNWGHSDFRTPSHDFMQALSRLSFLRSFVLVGRTAQGRAGQVQKEAHEARQYDKEDTTRIFAANCTFLRPRGLPQKTSTKNKLSCTRTCRMASVVQKRHVLVRGRGWAPNQTDFSR